MSTGAAVLALAVLTGCTGAGNPSGQSKGDIGYVPGGGTVVSVPVDERRPAPALEGEKVGGGAVSLADYRGSVVVVNVWGSWCAPCREETPDLVAAARELGRSGVEFVGINTKDNEAAAAAYQRSAGIPYPSFYDPDGRLMLELRDSVPPKSIPSTLLVDEQGRLATVVVGGVTRRSLSELVGKLLVEQARRERSTTTSPAERPSVTPAASGSVEDVSAG